MAGREVGDGAWRKSSASGDGHCAEVRLDVDGVHIRDTKDRQGPFLTFTYEEWDAFLAGVRRGEFDLPKG